LFIVIFRHDLNDKEKGILQFTIYE